MYWRTQWRGDRGAMALHGALMLEKTLKVPSWKVEKKIMSRLPPEDKMQ